MEKLSVIVTTFNRKYEVRRALEGVYAQTKQPYEVIIVDDCSTDGTEEYIQSFHFSGLQYYKTQLRSGPGAARNLGIRVCNGEYIAFLDSDNEWYPNKIEEFDKVISGQVQCDLIFSSYKKHVCLDTEIRPINWTGKGKIEDQMIWFENPADASATVYRKKFLEEAGLFSERIMTNIDWEILLRMGKKRRLNLWKIDKVLTENWTMYNSITEDKELEKQEKRALFFEYEREFFSAIMERSQQVRSECIETERQCENKVVQLQNVIMRKESFYQLLSSWMQLKLAGRSIADILKARKMNRIAIYGMGKHGKMLYQDLQGYDIKIEYFIDKNRDLAANHTIPVYEPTESLPEVDVIVITPYLEKKVIEEQLHKVCNYHLITLDELVK